VLLRFTDSAACSNHSYDRQVGELRRGEEHALQTQNGTYRSLLQYVLPLVRVHVHLARMSVLLPALRGKYGMCRFPGGLWRSWWCKPSPQDSSTHLRSSAPLCLHPLTPTCICLLSRSAARTTRPSWRACFRISTSAGSARLLSPRTWPSPAPRRAQVCVCGGWWLLFAAFCGCYEACAWMCQLTCDIGRLQMISWGNCTFGGHYAAVVATDVWFTTSTLSSVLYTCCDPHYLTAVQAPTSRCTSRC
jgi:hypothetical protein